MPGKIEVLEVLSTEPAPILTAAIAKKLKAPQDATRGMCGHLKKQKLVAGDGINGWTITDQGKTELEAEKPAGASGASGAAAAAEEGQVIVEKEPTVAETPGEKKVTTPTLINEGVTERDEFEAIGEMIGFLPRRIQLVAKIVFSGDYTDLKWVWEAILQAGIRKDLAIPWVNGWRAHLQKAIPEELVAVLTGEAAAKETSEKEEEAIATGKDGKPGRSYIIVDDMPVYAGKNRGDLFYQDALDLAHARLARLGKQPVAPSNPVTPASAAADFVTIIKAVREIDGGGAKKSYLVTPGADGKVTLQEVAPDMPMVINNPATTKPEAITYFADAETGEVKSLKAGEPIIIKQVIHEGPPAGRKILIIRQTPEGIVSEERDPNQPIIITQPVGGGIGGIGGLAAFPFPVMDAAGKPMLDANGHQVYTNLEPMLKLLGFQGDQKRAQERHDALMGIVSTVKDNIPDAIAALREAAAEVKAQKSLAPGAATPATEKPVYQCPECGTQFAMPVIDFERCACPNCHKEWSKDEVVKL